MALQTADWPAGLLVETDPEVDGRSHYAAGGVEIVARPALPAPPAAVDVGVAWSLELPAGAAWRVFDVTDPTLAPALAAEGAGPIAGARFGAAGAYELRAELWPWLPLVARIVAS